MDKFIIFAPELCRERKNKHIINTLTIKKQNEKVFDDFSCFCSCFKCICQLFK